MIEDSLRLVLDRFSERMIGTAEDHESKWDDDEELGGKFGSFNDLPIDALKYWDSLAATCDGCGWWVGASDLNEDSLCEDCAEDD